MKRHYKTLLILLFLVFEILLIIYSKNKIELVNQKFPNFIAQDLYSRLLFFVLTLVPIQLLVIWKRKFLVDKSKTFIAELTNKKLFPPRSSQQNLLLLSTFGVILIIRIIFLYFEPFDTDEVWSYLAFRNKPFVAPLLWYPIPGNHILQTFVSRLFLSVNISFPYLLRIPILITSLLTSYYIFLIAERGSSFRSAIVATLLFSFSTWIMYYGIEARGYSFILLIFSISLYHSFKWIENKNEYHLIFITILSILGFYTIPTYLYCYCSILVLLFFYCIKEEYKLIYPILTSIVITIIGTYILYIPIFIINGPKAVLGNEYVISLNYQYLFNNLINYIVELSTYLFSEFKLGWIIILSILISTSLFSIKKKKDGYFLWFILFTLLLPLFFILGQRVLPPFRIFLYLTVPITIWIAILSKKLLPKKSIILLALLVFQGYVFYVLFNKRYISYKKAQDLSANLIRFNADNYVFGDSYNAMVFEFEFYKQNKKFNFAYNDSLGQQYTYVYLKGEKTPKVIIAN